MDCHYCRKQHEPGALRPYGPGGSSVCFPCVRADPARERAAQEVYKTLLDANDAISHSGIVAIGESSGPRPFDPDELSYRT